MAIILLGALTTLMALSPFVAFLLANWICNFEIIVSF